MVPLEKLEVSEIWVGYRKESESGWSQKKRCKEIRLFFFFFPEDEEIDRYRVRIRNFIHIIFHHCKCHQ